MKYKEGPWWLPLVLAGGIFGAVFIAPHQTGTALHHMLRSSGQLLQSAFGEDNTTNPQPISLRLPSPQDGPPPTWSQG